MINFGTIFKRPVQNPTMQNALAAWQGASKKPQQPQGSWRQNPAIAGGNRQTPRPVNNELQQAKLRNMNNTNSLLAGWR
jgi:hypothetical protein